MSKKEFILDSGRISLMTHYKRVPRSPTLNFPNVMQMELEITHRSATDWNKQKSQIATRRLLLVMEFPGSLSTPPRRVSTKGLQTTDPELNLALCLFLRIKFYWNIVMPTLSLPVCGCVWPKLTREYVIHKAENIFSLALCKVFGSPQSIPFQVTRATKFTLCLKDTFLPKWAVSKAEL